MTATPAFTAGQVAALAERLGVIDEVGLEQLRIGMEVELEHGRRDALTNVTDDDPLLTAKIALAHLRELPDYYTRLAVMEAAGQGRQLRVRDTDVSRPQRGQRPIELILLRQLASYLDMPIFVVDAQGRLAYFNEPAEPLLGVRFDEVGMMEMADWLAAFNPGDQSGTILSADEVPLVVALRERRPLHRDLAIAGLDGVRRPIGATALPLTGQGGTFIGAVALFWPEPVA
jgi:PAS domain-containing protein